MRHVFPHAVIAIIQDALALWSLLQLDDNNAFWEFASECVCAQTIGPPAKARHSQRRPQTTAGSCTQLIKLQSWLLACKQLQPPFITFHFLDGRSWRSLRNTFCVQSRQFICALHMCERRITNGYAPSGKQCGKNINFALIIPQQSPCAVPAGCAATDYDLGAAFCTAARTLIYCAAHLIRTCLLWNHMKPVFKW